ncbi:MAG: hypothetical protein OEV31_04275 [Gammaproteobacteria bacterium]|nr:hypothetical protein [Gammaproteobacteria bacterium]
MQTLPVRTQVILGLALTVLFAITRGYHTPTVLQALPSFSWAAFFLAGVYLRPVWVPAALLGLAALIDYAAIVWGGVSSFCVSPAYVALIPAYAALWFAGRWVANHVVLTAASLPRLAASVIAGTFACELVSSGSFYFFSGRFAEPGLAEFGNRFLNYFPPNLGAVAFWVLVAGVLHLAISAGRAARGPALEK